MAKSYPFSQSEADRLSRPREGYVSSELEAKLLSLRSAFEKKNDQVRRSHANAASFFKTSGPDGLSSNNIPEDSKKGVMRLKDVLVKEMYRIDASWEVVQHNTRGKADGINKVLSDVEIRLAGGGGGGPGNIKRGRGTEAHLDWLESALRKAEAAAEEERRMRQEEEKRGQREETLRDEAEARAEHATRCRKEAEAHLEASRTSLRDMQDRYLKLEVQHQEVEKRACKAEHERSNLWNRLHSQLKRERATTNRARQEAEYERSRSSEISYRAHQAEERLKLEQKKCHKAQEIVQQLEDEREEYREKLKCAKEKGAWGTYDVAWSLLLSDTLSFSTIPWPTVKVPKTPKDITLGSVRKFLLNESHSDGQSKKERVKKALLRYHLDKFNQELDRVPEAEKQAVKEAVAAVTRHLNELMQEK